MLTQEFLAEMLCVHRPTLTMALRLFQTAGLVKLRRGGVSITDRAGLEEATCECYWLIRKGHENSPLIRAALTPALARPIRRPMPNARRGCDTSPSQHVHDVGG